MIHICPSILSADFSRLAEEIKDVESKGADCIHLDMMDGHFVPNLTFGVPIIAALRKHVSIPFDAHLMVEHPDVYVDGLAKAGVQYVTVHQEACPHLDSTLQHIRSAGMKCGVALNPATPVSSLSCVAAQLDMILIRSQGAARFRRQHGSRRRSRRRRQRRYSTGGQGSRRYLPRCGKRRIWSGRPGCSHRRAAVRSLYLYFYPLCAKIIGGYE